MTLVDQIIRDEGEVLHLYYDSLGVPTIGVGANLRDVRVPPDIAKLITITPEGSRMLLERRLRDAENDVTGRLPWAAKLDEARRAVLVNMAFNMGIVGLLQFHATLDAVQRGDWAAAAQHMLDSKWASQVDDRAKRLARQMQTGAWQ
jgi:lysozyme